MLAEGDIVLKARSVGKIYSRQQTVTRTRIGRALARAALGIGSGSSNEPSSKEFWSLNDVSLQVKRGEALGIIGLNGAGKTTLLRILAGQILPDAGEVEVVGKSASMIDLTAGFQTTATGRQNIYLRGAALGRSRAEIGQTIDSIIAFSELGDAIDAPVATYSSGMTMRLAFSIMVASTPDILFIDEVLAVGDFTFRQKCLEKLRKMREHTSFIMVSHSMHDIKTFCSRAIVLNKGQVSFEGGPAEAVGVYESLTFPEPISRGAKARSIVAPLFVNEKAISGLDYHWSDRNGRRLQSITSGQDLSLRVELQFSFTPRRLVIGVPVWLADGTFVTGFSSELQAEPLSASAGEPCVFDLEVPNLAFNPGEYLAVLGIMDGPEYLVRQQLPVLTVHRRDTPCWGLVTLPHSWQRKQPP